MRAVVEIMGHVIIRGDVEPSPLVAGGLRITPDSEPPQHVGPAAIYRVRSEVAVVAPWLADIAALEAEIAAGAATGAGCERRFALRQRDGLAHDDVIAVRASKVIEEHYSIPLAAGESDPNLPF